VPDDGDVDLSSEPGIEITFQAGDTSCGAELATVPVAVVAQPSFTG
jgi:hypothetical protein